MEHPHFFTQSTTYPQSAFSKNTEEFKMVAVFFLMMVILYGAVLNTLLGIDSNLRVIAVNLWISSTLYFFSLIPTFWVIRQHHQQNTRSTVFKAAKLTPSNSNNKASKLTL